MLCNDCIILIKQADELTLAVGQAFDLAYKKFKANQAAGKKEVDQMKQRVQSTEKENELLKKKLEELERSQAEVSPVAPSSKVIYLYVVIYNVDLAASITIYISKQIRFVSGFCR